ncbi:MAG: hypothetical protein ACPGU7_05575 [Gammaproteobacteria bacterium]
MIKQTFLKLLALLALMSFVAQPMIAAADSHKEGAKTEKPGKNKGAEEEPDCD